MKKHGCMSAGWYIDRPERPSLRLEVKPGRCILYYEFVGLVVCARNSNVCIFVCNLVIYVTRPSQDNKLMGSYCCLHNIMFRRDYIVVLCIK